MENITVQQAGRMGGLATLYSRGPGHFAVIGKKGQATTRKLYPDMAKIWGAKGGRPKKTNL
jgi:hypothetical protein